MTKKIIPEYLREELDTLKVGESMCKKEFIKKHWHTVDYFSRRSFDVVFCKLKKTFEDKEFDGRLNLEIKRVR